MKEVIHNGKKYSIGDKVKLKGDLEKYIYFSRYTAGNQSMIVSDMKEWFNKEITIESIFYSPTFKDYLFKVKENCFLWPVRDILQNIFDDIMEDLKI